MAVPLDPSATPGATRARASEAAGEPSLAHPRDGNPGKDASSSGTHELGLGAQEENADQAPSATPSEPVIEPRRRAGKDTLRDIEDLETQLLLDGILHRYGYDFRNYAPASLRRRVRMIVEQENLASISALQERLLRDPTCMARFITNLSVPVTAMFRDPAFYRALRGEVVPLLRTYPFVRIWHAGCSTGEEVYSLAILLTEEGLYERCRIYATDLSDATLERAQRGIYDLARMRDYTLNYQAFGGRQEFSSYYTADRARVVFSPRLRKNVVFSQHNLVSDGPFNEFNLILCRNVMIYFDRTLRSRVLTLLDSSLCRLGVLGIGRKESLEFSNISPRYAEFPSKVRLYRKEA